MSNQDLSGVMGAVLNTPAEPPAEPQPAPAAAPSQASPDAGAGVPEPSAVQVAPASGAPTFSDHQARELADVLIAQGIPRERVEAALRADGIEPPPQTPDTRTDAEREFDDFFAAPETPEGYKISYVNRLPAGLDPAAGVEFHREATSWLAAMEFPEQVGPGVIEQALDAGQRFNAMSPTQRELWKMEQTAYFERLAGGPEKAAERSQLAAKALARAPKGFTDALFQVGALHDAGIIMQLANQGERLAARGK